MSSRVHKYPCFCWFTLLLTAVSYVDRGQYEDVLAGFFVKVLLLLLISYDYQLLTGNCCTIMLYWLAGGVISRPCFWNIHKDHKWGSVLLIWKMCLSMKWWAESSSKQIFIFPYMINFPQSHSAHKFYLFLTTTCQRSHSWQLYGAT